MAGPGQAGSDESVTKEGWQAGGSEAGAGKRCMEETRQEQLKRWNWSPFDSELVWAARTGMDWWVKEHSSL